jgi:hypothetical protein
MSGKVRHVLLICCDKPIKGRKQSAYSQFSNIHSRMPYNANHVYHASQAAATKAVKGHLINRKLQSKQRISIISIASTLKLNHLNLNLLIHAPHLSRARPKYSLWLLQPTQK